MRTILGVILGVAVAVGVIYAALDVRGLEGARQLVAQLTNSASWN